MTTKHLSEEELQQYSIDKSSCDIEASSHIQSCASCKANVEAYRQLFTVIHDQPKQVFGFDLSNLVLKQLPESKSKFSVNSVFAFRRSAVNDHIPYRYHSHRYSRIPEHGNVQEISKANEHIKLIKLKLQHNCSMPVLSFITNIKNKQ